MVEYQIVPLRLSVRSEFRGYHDHHITSFQICNDDASASGRSLGMRSTTQSSFRYPEVCTNSTIPPPTNHANAIPKRHRSIKLPSTFS